MEIVYPDGQWVEFTPFDTYEYAFESAMKVAADNTEPKTFAEAMRRPDLKRWLEAAQAEMQAHVDNGTWEIVQLPSDRNAIGSRSVFKIKRDASGNIEQYKGCLVAQGYSQRYKIDFNDTYAPTMRFAAIRALLTIGALEDWEIESVDISNAYLNGVPPENEVVYMHQPEGFQQGGKEYVCKLQKGLYGLKQSGRLWYKKLASVLEGAGLVRMVTDPSIYVWEKEDMKVITPVFVDDMTILSPSTQKSNEVKALLRKHFKTRDLSPISYLLGIAITHDRQIVPSNSLNANSLLISSNALVWLTVNLSPLP